MERKRIVALISSVGDADEQQLNAIIDEINDDFAATAEQIRVLQESNEEIAQRLEETRKKYVAAVLGATTPDTAEKPETEQPERATFDSLFEKE